MRKKPPLEVGPFQRAYHKGVPVTRMSKASGVCSHRIIRALKLAGVELVPRGKGVSGLTPEQSDALDVLREELGLPA